MFSCFFLGKQPISKGLFVGLRIQPIKLGNKNEKRRRLFPGTKKYKSSSIELGEFFHSLSSHFSRCGGLSLSEVVAIFPMSRLKEKVNQKCVYDCCI